MDQLMDALRNSTRMFVIVAVLGAVYNLISGLFFTDAGKKRRFRATCVISLITLVLFAVLYLVVLPIISDVSLVINGLSVLYTLLSFIFALVTMIKGSEDKANRSFALSRMFAFATALLFLALTVLRQYDLIVFADELDKLVADTKYPSLASVEGALSNNIFHGFAIAMGAIAAIGTFVMTLLNLWKEDKHRFLVVLSVVVIVAYMMFPTYRAEYSQTPETANKISDSAYPAIVSVSGISLLLGITEGVALNIPLSVIIFGGLMTFIVCQMLEYKHVGSVKVRNVKAISLIIVALGFIFTSSFAGMSIGPAIIEQTKVVEEFATTWNLPLKVGVAGLTSTFGLLLVALAILSVLKAFCRLLKHYRYIIMSFVALVAILMVFTSELYRIPGVTSWTGTQAMLGIMGASYFNILWVIALASVVIGFICGLLAQADDQALSKFFRRVSAFFLMVAGLIVLFGETVIISSLTPTAKTVLTFQRVAGKLITVSDIFVKAGLMLIAASVIMVIAGWKRFILGLVRFVRDGAGRKFVATLGAIALLAIVAFVMMNGSVQTQVLVDNVAVVKDYKFMDILMGTSVPEGTYGLAIRIILFAIIGITAFAGLSMLFGDIIYKKKYGIQKFAFTLVLIVAIVLALTNAVSGLLIGATNKVIYSQSLAVFALLMFVVGLLTMYKAGSSVFKGMGEFVVNNVALNAAIFSLIFIVLYMLGILTNPLK